MLTWLLKVVADSMPFERGHKKHGGRKRETPNKLTGKMREVLSSTVEAELAILPQLLSEMKPSERATILVRLLPYVLPPPRPEEEEKVSMEGGVINWGGNLIHI
jgi:hypothetical protein